MWVLYLSVASAVFRPEENGLQKKDRNAVLKRHQGDETTRCGSACGEASIRCCDLKLHAGPFTEHSPALASFAGVAVPPVILPRCPFQVSMICCVGGGMGGGCGSTTTWSLYCASVAIRCCARLACLDDALLGPGKEDALTLWGALRFLLADRRVPRVPGR